MVPQIAWRGGIHTCTIVIDSGSWSNEKAEKVRQQAGRRAWRRGRWDPEPLSWFSAAWFPPLRYVTVRVPNSSTDLKAFFIGQKQVSTSGFGPNEAFKYGIHSTSHLVAVQMRMDMARATNGRITGYSPQCRI